MIGVVVGLVVAAAPCDEWTDSRWTNEKLPRPCELRSVPAARRAREAASRYGLSSSSAACFLNAEGVIEDMTEKRESSARAFDAWSECVQRDPTQFALWFGLFEAALFARGETLDWASVEAALDALPDPVPLADRLRMVKYGHAAPFLRIITKRHPDRLAALLGDAATQGAEAFELALPLVDSGAARVPPFSCEEWMALGRGVLEFTLDRGFLALSAETWAKLPPCATTALLRDGLWSYASSSTGLVRSEDLRPRLALALALRGDLPRARAVPVIEPDAGRQHRSSNTPLLRALVIAATDGGRAIDPWEAGVLFDDSNIPLEALPTALAYLSPYAAFAQRHAEWVLKNSKDAIDADEQMTPALRDRLESGRRAALAVLRERWPLLRSAADAGAGPVEERADGGGATFPPSPALFTERTAPYRGPKARAAPAKLPGAPEQFWTLRVELTNRGVVALAASQRLDPVGEVGPGGLWLLVSPDGGAPLQPVYTGLIDRRPYHPLKESAVPLLSGDTVRIEVDDAPIDDATVTFPPIGVQAQTRRKHVVLEGSLAALMRDTDRDGLSDLEETRMLLDPANLDTDGDGLSDGIDPTPRLSSRATPTPVAAALNAFFEFMAGEDRAPAAIVLQPHSSEDGGSLCQALGPRRATQLEDVRFLVGSPEELAGLQPFQRVITLTDGELKRAQRRFGTFYPMDLFSIVSKDGRHVFLRWSERWRGGRVRVDLVEGRWVVTDLGSWVT